TGVGLQHPPVPSGLRDLHRRAALHPGGAHGHGHGSGARGARAPRSARCRVPVRAGVGRGRGPVLHRLAHTRRREPPLLPGRPGPACPVQWGAGPLSEPGGTEVEGRSYTGSPPPDDENRHYYPGGRVDGRPVPSGWYNTPWWQPALAGVGGAMVGVMVFNAMLAPAYAGGMVEGASADAAGDGGDAGADAGGEGGDAGDGGGDFGGDFGGGD